MPRLIDATLAAALAAGNGRPVITAYLGTTAGVASVSGTPVRYKLTGTTLELEIPSDSNNNYPAMWLKRGVEIGGVEYTLTTGRFRVTRLAYPPGRVVAYGELFPTAYYAAAADDTYQNVIEAFCAAQGKTAVFKDPAAAWLGYQFFPAGKQVILNNANSFLNLLRQKYLIFACDNGNEEVLFYACDQAMPAADVTYHPTADFERTYNYRTARLFLWRDENQAVHTDGAATDPVHNLGYLESTASPPARHSITWGSWLTTRPDLSVLDGDIFALVYGGQTVKNYALVTEEYAAPGAGHAGRYSEKRPPRWCTTIQHNPVFGNTEGGAMPSTIERVSNYTPLNTGSFDGVLSGSANNLQAAMEMLDEHHHSAKVYNSAAQATTSGVFLTLAWDREEWDNGAIHDTAINNDRLTCQVAGVYDIICQAEFAANATGRRALVIYRNGSAIATTKVMAVTDAGATTCFQCHARVSLAAGDTVNVQAFQASGVGLNISAAQSQTWFSMARIN